MSSSLDCLIFRNTQSIPPLKTFCIQPLHAMLFASALVQTLVSSNLAYLIILLSDHHFIVY